MPSPSTSILASVIFSMSCAYCSFENTPSMTFTVVNGILPPFLSYGHTAAIVRLFAMLLVVWFPDGELFP